MPFLASTVTSQTIFPGLRPTGSRHRNAATVTERSRCLILNAWTVSTPTSISSLLTLLETGFSLDGARATSTLAMRESPLNSPSPAAYAIPSRREVATLAPGRKRPGAKSRTSTGSGSSADAVPRPTVRHAVGLGGGSSAFWAGTVGCSAAGSGGGAGSADLDGGGGSAVLAPSGPQAVERSRATRASRGGPRIGPG